VNTVQRTKRKSATSLPVKRGSPAEHKRSSTKAVQTGSRPKKPADVGKQTDADPGPAAADTAAVLKSPDSSLAFTTPAARERLARLGVFRLEDIVLHLPLRYEDETTLTPISVAQSGISVQVEGVVAETDVNSWSRVLKTTVARCTCVSSIFIPASRRLWRSDRVYV